MLRSYYISYTRIQESGAYRTRSIVADGEEPQYTTLVVALLHTILVTRWTLLLLRLESTFPQPADMLRYASLDFISQRASHHAEVCCFSVFQKASEQS